MDCVFGEGKGERGKREMKRGESEGRKIVRMGYGLRDAEGGKGEIGESGSAVGCEGRVLLLPFPFPIFPRGVPAMGGGNGWVGGG